MEILIIQKEAFEEMAAKFQLNISPRTLQTLRDNGTLAYSQINHKVFYKPEDMLSIVKLIEGKRTDRVV